MCSCLLYKILRICKLKNFQLEEFSYRIVVAAVVCYCYCCCFGFGIFYATFAVPFQLYQIEPFARAFS